MKLSFLLLIPLLLTGCGVSKLPQQPVNQKIKTQQTHYAKIMKEFNGWKGTKYLFGGTTKRGVDCSAFIGHVYKDAFNKKLPRTTTQLKHEGVKVSTLKVGDMVFFRKNKHVGIYIGNNQFVHSSSKKGVIVSDLSQGYYKKAFTQARRVL